jgi:hypothetical protein
MKELENLDRAKFHVEKAIEIIGAVGTAGIIPLLVLNQKATEREKQEIWDAAETLKMSIWKLENKSID